MHIYQEYFKEPEERTYFYTAKVLSPGSGNTWFIQSVITDKDESLKISEFEAKVIEEKEQHFDAELALVEKSELRDFVYSMVGQLIHKERSVIKNR